MTADQKKSEDSFGALAPRASLNFASNSDVNMVVEGTPLATNLAVIDAGFSLRVSDRVNLGSFYLGQYGVQAVNSGVRGNLSVKF